MGVSRESFVLKTKELIEQEREAELDETRSLHENVSARELERRGVALTRLHIASTHTGLFGRTVVVFEPHFPRKEMPSNSFSSGDIAGISLSRSDDGNESLGSGIVSRVTPSTVSIAFDENVDTAALDGQHQYKLVKLANDVTYRRLKRAVNDLNIYRGGPSSQLIDVLFGETDLGPPISVARDGKDAFDKDKVTYYNTRLDDSQQAAVQFALCQRELAIIHGPPGTGKTTTVVEIILQAINQGLKILACAPSNVAVDNLIERLAAYKAKVIRLGHPARLLDSIQKLSLDAIMRHSEEAEVSKGIREDLQNAMDQLKKAKNYGEKKALHGKMSLMRKELRQQEAKTMNEVLKRADVVGATLTSATGDGPLKHLDNEHFDLIIIDECSQAVEAACWIPLLRGPRTILAGDHLQLPPTIISHKAAKEGLAHTLMERQLALHGEKAMRMLTVQYRMNQHIMKWASDELYEGKLTAHSSVAQHLLKDLPGIADTEDTSTALLLVDTVGCNLWELDVPDEISKGNEGEVDLCVVHVEKLIKAGLDPSNIAVIAPYNLQVDLLRLQLSQKYPKLEIKSVDGFQGREKEAVVISMVRSNDKREVGFLAENRRINVAITRARRHLAVVCDSETIGAHSFLQRLVDYMSEHGEVRSAEQYIQEGQIDPTAKRHGALQDKFDQITISQKSGATKAKKPKQKQASGASSTSVKEAVRQADKGVKTYKPEKSAQQIEQEREEDDELKKTILQFVANTDKQVLAFPPTLNNAQRFKVHELAEALGLQHASTGEKSERHIVVSKGGAQPVQPTRQSTETESKHVSQNTPSATSMKDAESKIEQLQGKQQLASKQSTEKTSKIEFNNCPRCHRDIPISNWTLHEVRCSPAKVELEEKADTATRREPQSARPKSSKKKAKKNKTPAQEEDFDALIEAAMKDNAGCHMARCKEITTTLGQNCAFCAKRFCIKHHMAEMHGCGAAAKSHARQMISREGVLYRGSGIPDKKPDSAKRAHLQRKLDKKLDEMTSSRKTKSSKKGSSDT